MAYPLALAHVRYNYGPNLSQTEQWPLQWPLVLSLHNVNSVLLFDVSRAPLLLSPSVVCAHPVGGCPIGFGRHA